MASQVTSPRLRFDRHELAGAFGDIGTDLPLIVGLVAICRLDSAAVCVVIGLLGKHIGQVLHRRQRPCDTK